MSELQKVEKPLKIMLYHGTVLGQKNDNKKRKWTTKKHLAEDISKIMANKKSDTPVIYRMRISEWMRENDIYKIDNNTYLTESSILDKDFIIVNMPVKVSEPATESDLQKLINKYNN